MFRDKIVKAVGMAEGSTGWTGSRTKTNSTDLHFRIFTLIYETLSIYSTNLNQVLINLIFGNRLIGRIVRAFGMAARVIHLGRSTCYAKVAGGISQLGFRTAGGSTGWTGSRTRIKLTDLPFRIFSLIYETLSIYPTALYQV